MTRAFTAMGHGEWAAAVRESPAGVIFYLATAGVFVACTARLIRPARAELTPDPGKTRAWQKGTLIAGTLILLANWIYRLAMGMR